MPVWATKRFFSRLPERLEERLDRFGRALDDVLEGRDPLQQVLVERDLFLRLPRTPRRRPTPESTRSFELQRAQNSSSSGFLRPQTWQYIVLRPQALSGRSGRGIRRSPPRFLAQPAGVHHPDQQRARPVLRVAEAVLEDAQDGETGVQADEVGERAAAPSDGSCRAS